MDTTAATRAGRRQWLGLAVLALPTLLVSIDVFVMLLALPQLSLDLHASSSQQLWIMDSYGFLLSGFMITMGTLGDRIGRRRLLLLGATGFGAASVLAAFAPSPGLLIAARMALGVAGATLAPSTLALISDMFRDGRQRALAIGIWFGCFMGGAVIGPVVGGVMLTHFWWGSVFLLGVPAMVLLLVLGPVLLPAASGSGGGRLDLTSVALSLSAILPVVYGIKEMARAGVHPVPVGAVVLGLAVGVAFVRRQRALAGPLLDLRLFANGAFRTALGGMLFGTMLMGAIMLFITQYLELVGGFDPLRAGFCMLPAVGCATVSFLTAPLVARRVRPARLIGAGLAVSVGGLLLLTQVDAQSGVTPLIAGFALVNLGAGPLVTLSTDLIVGSAPPERAGSAAAMGETSGELGFALGIAALGSIGTANYRAELAGTLPAGAPPAAADTLAGATTAAAALPEPLAGAVLGAARAAFTSGFHTVALISAVLLAGVAVITVRRLRHVPASAEVPANEPAAVG